MSNSERFPKETMCAAGSADAVQILEPREVPLGGLRAMDVRRTLPQRSRSLIGAWCFLDHYGPDAVSATGGMNVDAHPHIGLQTASWLFSGEIEHRDSAGFHAVVKPGELNLMTAGRGISHSERSTPETEILHGAQLWIALPSDKRDTPKTLEHYVPPVVRGSGWRAQVFLGSLLGSTSDVVTHSPLVGAEIRIEASGSLDFPVDPGYEHGVLVDSGEVTLERSGQSGADRVPVAEDHLAYLPPGSERLRIVAGGEGARILVIGGEPFAEDLVMWWNFVGSDHEEIARARADWQAQIAAAGVADVAVVGAPGPAVAAAGNGAGVTSGTPDAHRFGLPENEPEPPLSAPPLPLARLIPRER